MHFANRVRGFSSLISYMLCIATTAGAQRVVHETAAQWKSASALKLTVERNWCDGVDAAGCDFKNIASAIALADGGIIAAGATGPINRFSNTARFMGAIGRKGQGPGEYGFLNGVNQTSDGMLAWFDNMQMRIATIGLDGKPGPIARLMPPYTMDNMWMVGNELVVLDVPAAPTRGDTVVASFHTVPATGAPRVLATVRTPSTFTLNSDMRPMPAPFAPRVVSSVGVSGNVAHSNGAQYAVDVFPVNGKPWRLEVEKPLRTISQADRDSASSLLLRRFRVANIASLPAAVQTSLQATRSMFPQVTSIRVLRDGTVWIRPIADAGANAARWDAFTADGQRIGYATLPFTADICDGTRNWLLVVELGDDDVPRVVRYRL